MLDQVTQGCELTPESACVSVAAGQGNLSSSTTSPSQQSSIILIEKKYSYHRIFDLCVSKPRLLHSQLRLDKLNTAATSFWPRNIKEQQPNGTSESVAPQSHALMPGQSLTETL
jgi:hypothetical protein